MSLLSYSSSSRLMARCWLPLLVLCVSGLWCHPVPEKSNTDKGAVIPLRASAAQVEEPGQQSDLADNDYPEMMTEFLRLTTTIPTVAASTNTAKSSDVSLPSTTTTKTTTTATKIQTLPTTSVTTTAPPIQKAVQTAAAKFSPTVSLTTTAKSTTKATTEIPAVSVVEKEEIGKEEIGKEETTTDRVSQPAQDTTAVEVTSQPEATTMKGIATPNLPMKSKQQPVAQQMIAGQVPALNSSKQQKVVPTQIKQVTAQKTTVPATATVQQQQQSAIPATVPIRQQVPVAQQPGAVNQPQQQPSVFPVAFQQQVPNLVQQSAVSNQPQQQPMSVLPAAFKQQVPNFAQQPFGSNQPQQQQMAVSTTAVQQPNVVQAAASNAPILGPRPPIAVPVPSSFNPATVQQPMMMPNPPFAPQQQPYPMPNPFQQRLQQQAMTTLVNSRKTVVAPANRLGSGTRQVFIRGGNGTPTHLIPISQWPQYIQTIKSNGVQMISPSVVSTTA